MKASAANDSNTNEEGSETAGDDVEENKKKAAFADDKKKPLRTTETNVEIENITQGKGSKSEGEIWKTQWCSLDVKYALECTYQRLFFLRSRVRA